MTNALRSFLTTSEALPLDRAALWASWLVTARTSARMTINAAILAHGYSGSAYNRWRAWENGKIPPAETVERIADVLHADRDEALLAAGYAPSSLPAHVLLDAIRTYNVRDLHPVLAEAIGRVTRMPLKRQQELGELITAYVDAYAPV